MPGKPAPGGFLTIICVGIVFLMGATLARAQSPWATTQAAAPTSATNSTLNGMVTPRGQATQAWFEWGLDANYTQTTPLVNVGSGVRVVRVSAFLAGLQPGGIYHYRVVALNASGLTYGADHQFTTGTRVSTWGDFSAGRTPLPGGLTNIVAIGCGHTHDLAIKTDGTVVSWMSYLASNVGQTNVPAGLTNVTAVAGGWVHSLALRQDGTVAVWGRYYDNGNDVGPAFVPAGLTNVIAIAGGDEHSVALRLDGSVRAWGLNAHGELNVPSSATNIVAISAGSTHTIALKADGTVIAWGSSVGGDMTPPAGLSNVIAIASEGWHNLALKVDGTVVAWGSNQYGQSALPPSLSDVVAIADGFQNSLALLRNGQLVPWGTQAFVSALPSLLTNVVAIASGDFQTLTLAAVNLPPTAFSRKGTGLANSDVVVSLAGWDPNGDPLRFRTVSLPAKGALYQFSTGGRGDLITGTNTLISDPLGRVIFAPAANAFGVPYDSFSYVADDGELESVAASMTLNVITSPLVQAGGFAPAVGPGFSLNFIGITNVSYEVFGSTDLKGWGAVGFATQPVPGQFSYTDASAGYIPQRFYRVRVINPP